MRQELGDDPTGHDWWHVDRVRRLGVEIAEREGVDPFVVELTALLHDIEDFKFSGSEEAGPERAREWLASIGVAHEISDEVALTIRGMSFRGAAVEEMPLSAAGRCVQDADRLDAIGDIGIARTFAYGGFVRRPIHDPDVDPVLHDSADSYRSSRGTTLNHFHEKLLLLKDRMNTPSAREAAERRHQFLVKFLSEFEAEWYGRAPAAVASKSRRSLARSFLVPLGLLAWTQGPLNRVRRRRSG